MTNIRDQIREYILTHLLPGESAAKLCDDTPLRTSGLLDSMATLQLVNFIEGTFGIEIATQETGIKHFDQLGDVADLVERKVEELHR